MASGNEGKRRSIQTCSSLQQTTYSGSSKPKANGGIKIPVIRTLGQLRRWRKEARDKGLEVGVVPTMGALHEGHLNLVRTSLARHPLTVMTLFVNPMQFAPHEDLSAYPRTFERDMSLLQTLLPSTTQPRSLRGLGVSEFDSFRTPPSPRSASDPRPRSLNGNSQDSSPVMNGGGVVDSPLVVFAPTPDVMYPLKGELQDLGKHRGLSVELRGWGEVMEGASRPQFFKGVATVCTKLFNAVEPDHAYFGQKDIQQALLLKILVQDLLLSHPTPDNLHILPTTRSSTGLALSSRNAYLSPPELHVSPVLYRALSAAKDLYASSASEGITGEDLIAAGTRVILDEQEQILSPSTSMEQGRGVELQLDYIEVFDKYTFEPIRGPVGEGREFVVAGAVWVGKTRLIDNLLVGWEVDQ
ncbi:pantoate-beta-alanine ligase [Kwoniella heveanensis CBS 569]|nr:pantoate-beta-alanine ligase [Kwoniella heveanensis CBS 569]